MQITGFKVIRHDTGGTVREGDELWADHNIPVAFLGIASEPWGDDETGEWHPAQLSVRYSWGSVEKVKATRLGVSVNEA